MLDLFKTNKRDDAGSLLPLARFIWKVGEREIDSESNNKSYLYLINEVYIHMKCTCTDQTNTESPKDSNKGTISTTESTLRRMRLLQYISTVFPVQHPNAT